MCLWKHFDKQSRVRTQQINFLSWVMRTCLACWYLKERNFSDLILTITEQRSSRRTQGKLAWLPLRHTRTWIPSGTAKISFALLCQVGSKTIVRYTHDPEESKAPGMDSVNWILVFPGTYHSSTGIKGERGSFHQCSQRSGFLGKNLSLPAGSAEPHLAQSRAQLWETPQSMVRAPSEWVKITVE